MSCHRRSLLLPSPSRIVGSTVAKRFFSLPALLVLLLVPDVGPEPTKTAPINLAFAYQQVLNLGGTFVLLLEPIRGRLLLVIDPDGSAAGPRPWFRTRQPCCRGSSRSQDTSCSDRNSEPLQVPTRRKVVSSNVHDSLLLLTTAPLHSRISNSGFARAPN